jgi:hypothetical protein
VTICVGLQFSSTVGFQESELLQAAAADCHIDICDWMIEELHFDVNAPDVSLCYLFIVIYLFILIYFSLSNLRLAARCKCSAFNDNG